MMVFNKSRVVIYIEPTKLHYQLVESSGKVNENFIVYQDLADIDQFMHNLKLPRLTSIELNLSDDFVQYQKTTYPDVKLTVSELTSYVEASLYKLFQQSANQLFFDFVAISPKTLMIAICERKMVNDWLDLFQKYGVTFVGSHFENSSFNFLPWRKQKAKKQQFKLLLFVVNFIGVLTCYFFYLLMNTQSDIEYYSQQLSAQQVLQQKLLAESYIANPSLSQIQIQQSLKMFSNKLPATIWLTLYEYEPEKIKITGRSVSYMDIINFNQQLSANVTKSQVTNIEKSQDSLLFQMDIELNE